VNSVSDSERATAADKAPGNRSAAEPVTPFVWSFGAAVPVLATSLTILAGLLPAISVIRRYIAIQSDSSIPIDAVFAASLPSLIADGAVALFFVAGPFLLGAFLVGFSASRLQAMREFRTGHASLRAAIRQDTSVLSSLTKRMEQGLQRIQKLRDELTTIPAGTDQSMKVELRIDTLVAELESLAGTATEFVRTGNERRAAEEAQAGALRKDLAAKLGHDPTTFFRVTRADRLRQAALRVFEILLIPYLVYSFLFDLAFPAQHVMFVVGIATFLLLMRAAEQAGRVSLRITLVATAILAIATGIAYGLTPIVPRATFVRAADAAQFPSGWYGILTQTDETVFMRNCETSLPRVFRVPQGAIALQETFISPFVQRRLTAWDTVKTGEVRTGLLPGCGPHPDSP
jgi:hypothetical protein